MAKWTTTCFDPYWPSSGGLKRTGLGSYYMHCARTRLRAPVLLRQPEDGQYGPKHVVAHLAIKYTYVTQLCLTI